MITVRIPYTVLPDIELALIKGGMPPLEHRFGMMVRWYDPAADEWVHEYTPVEDTLHDV